MRLSNAQDSNQGFTLIELLVVIVIAGIVAAISAPSLLSLLNRSRINTAQAELHGLLQEAQRQAIRGSRSCTISFNSNSISGNCLVTGNLELNNLRAGDLRFNDVSLRSNAPSSSFQFNYKGEISTANPVTIVISSTNSNLQKCVVLSAPLGLLRSGTYTGARSTTTESSCVAEF